MSAAAEIKKLLGSLGKKTEEPVNPEINAPDISDPPTEFIPEPENPEETTVAPEELGGPSEPTREQLEDQLTAYADMWREEKAERYRLQATLEIIRDQCNSALNHVTESETDD